METKRTKYGGRKAGTPNVNRKDNFKRFNLTQYQRVKGVYILKCKNRYKIGMTSNLYQRISLLNSMNAFGVDIVNIITIEDNKSLEYLIHEILKKKLVNGREWFELDFTDVNILRNMSNKNIDTTLIDLKNNNLLKNIHD